MTDEGNIVAGRPVLTQSQILTEEDNEAETIRTDERGEEPEGVGGEGQPEAMSEEMFDPERGTFMTFDENGQVVQAGHEEGETIVAHPEETETQF